MTDATHCQALKAAESALDFWGLDQPKCPHCGADYDASANDAWQIYEEGEHELDCPVCEMQFTVSTRVSHSFSTDEQPDEESPS